MDGAPEFFRRRVVASQTMFFMRQWRSRRGWSVAAAVGLTLGATLAAVRESANPPEVRESIRAQLEGAMDPAGLFVRGEPLRTSTATPSFYELRGYRPAWLKGARPRPAAYDLVQAIRDSEREGLTPRDYHLRILTPLLPSTEQRGDGADFERLASLDILLTDAFLVLGAHLVNGRVDPVTFDPEWIAVRREVDLLALLDQVVADGDPRRALDGLRPAHAGYRRLVEALGHYRAIEASGGWPRIPSGPVLKPEGTDERTVLLRTRLKASGDIAEEHAEPAEAPERYDTALEAAVRRFQMRHGLEVDGVVGSRTIEAMNVPVSDRVRQIETSLERWRWVPRDLGPDHLLVNIPEFRLHVFEAGESVMEMNVIVGREARRTPVFSDVVRYLVLNPSWEVPPTILRRDKLPEIRKDPGYAARNNMRLFRLAEGSWREIDPHEVDWSATPASSLRLRQEPGPNNALGRIKFMFPNRFNVYLHDTPSRELFAKADRGFSSGCIRIEKPFELAVHLLRGDPAWGPQALRDALETGRERTVMLPRPLPVHLLYWTAFVGPEGLIEFRRDIYGRDAKLDQVLDNLSAVTGP